MQKLHLAVLGDTAVDIVIRVDDKRDFEEELIFRQLDIRLGGIAANVAGQVAALGYSVEFWTVIGEDLFRHFLLSELRTENLKLHASILSGPSTRNVILVRPNGERTIFSDIGTHILLASSLSDLSSVQDFRYVHIPAFPAYWPLIDLLSQCGPTISVDFGFLKRLDELEEYTSALGEKVDLVFLSGSHLNTTSIEYIESALLKAGTQYVFTTLGRRGARVATANQRIYMEAFAVDMVDATGAGDSFAAGVLVGLLQERSITECVQFGQATAALRLSSKSANLATMEQVMSFLKANAK